MGEIYFLLILGRGWKIDELLDSKLIWELNINSLSNGET